MAVAMSATKELIFIIIIIYYHNYYIDCCIGIFEQCSSEIYLNSSSVKLPCYSKVCKYVVVPSKE